MVGEHGDGLLRPGLHAHCAGPEPHDRAEVDERIVLALQPPQQASGTDKTVMRSAARQFQPSHPCREPDVQIRDQPLKIALPRSIIQ
jgi:hypothetical protein